MLISKDAIENIEFSDWFYPPMSYSVNVISEVTDILAFFTVFMVSIGIRHMQTKFKYSDE